MNDGARLRYAVPSGKHTGDTRMIVRRRHLCDARNPGYPSDERLDVLVVGDNKLHQGVAATLLDDLGCTYEFACTGLEALGLALRKNFDVILMDNMAPKPCDTLLPQSGTGMALNGGETTRGADPSEPAQSKPRASSISMTVMSMREDVQSYLEAGMDGSSFAAMEGHGLRRLIQYAQNRVQR